MAGKAATALLKMNAMREVNPDVRWVYKGKPVLPGSRAVGRRRG